MKRFIVISSLVVALNSLAACGFRPIHASYGENAQLQQELASVDINYISTILNQTIASSLSRLLNPENKDAPTRYLLSLDAESSHSALAIQLDQEVTRYKTTVRANYTLKDIKQGTLITEGIYQREGSYDVVESEYAEHVSRKETERRVAKEIAQDIKLDVLTALMQEREE